MKCFEIEGYFLIPANKICEVAIDPENKKKLYIWLDGGQVQTILTPSEEDTKAIFKDITEVIKEL